MQSVRESIMKIKILITFLIAIQSVWAVPDVRVRSVRGNVQVRRGLDETWKPAETGMLLQNIDTILTGEVSEVVLVLDNGNTFTLGGFSILDIGDLRRISERELFLYLMSQKLKRIEYQGDSTKIPVTDIAVVRAENKNVQVSTASSKPSEANWQLEMNTAKALHVQRFYPNTIVKLHKIMSKYTLLDDDGEIQYLLGRTFEVINEPGRALDAYQAAVEQIEDLDSPSRSAMNRADECRKAIERLKE